MLCTSFPLPHGQATQSNFCFVLQNCGHFGHIARVCPNDAAEYGAVTRAPPPGRGLNVASLPPVKCYRCGGPNHMARYAKGGRMACAPLADLPHQGLLSSAVRRHRGHERREAPRQDVLQV